MKTIIFLKRLLLFVVRGKKSELDSKRQQLECQAQLRCLRREVDSGCEHPGYLFGAGYFFPVNNRQTSRTRFIRNSLRKK